MRAQLPLARKQNKEKSSTRLVLAEASRLILHSMWLAPIYRDAQTTIQNGELSIVKVQTYLKFDVFWIYMLWSLGYPKSVTKIFCTHFWVNKSLSMMWRQCFQKRPKRFFHSRRRNKRIFRIVVVFEAFRFYCMPAWPFMGFSFEYGTHTLFI
jgi:hypothetical protein